MCPSCALDSSNITPTESGSCRGELQTTQLLSQAQEGKFREAKKNKNPIVDLDLGHMFLVLYQQLS